MSTSLLVSIIFALCVNAGNKEQQIDCHETYLNCIITGKSDGSWNEKDIKRCTNVRNKN